MDWSTVVQAVANAIPLATALVALTTSRHQKTKDRREPGKDTE
jgi:hypothetical protein